MTGFELRTFSTTLATALALLTAAGAEARVQLRADGLEPAFRSGQADYTLPADTCGERFDFEVSAPGHSEVRIGDGRYQERGDSRRLKLEPGQAVKVRVRDDETSDPYFVRCLPADFPEFSFERYSRPASPLYVVTPASMSGQTAPNYVIIFDRRGVPVWWHADDRDLAADGKVLDDGTIAFARQALAGATEFEDGYEIVDADGSLVHTVRAQGCSTDSHDLQQTADGNYMVLCYVTRTARTDASAYNGDSAARVKDAVIQKVSPAGELLWQWRSQDHIGLAETGRWWGRLSEPYDLVHINAVEETADGDYLISLRHTDAVYRLDGSSGAIEWKLGGTETARSLEVIGDPYAGASLFGGQHDVRELADGTVTLHDNGTELGRSPRAVRYEIRGGTATLVDSVSDPEVPSSPCCGSARFIGGAWIASWGGTGTVSELAGGERTFALEFAPGAGTTWSYRAFPVDAQTDADELRRGMNRKVGLRE